jgi:hypothetical protein
MAWDLLFTSDIGLLSLFTIVFILGMGVYLVRYASKHIHDEEKTGGGGRMSGSH